MGAPPLGRLTWGTSAALVSPRQHAPPSARARGVPTRRQSPHPGCIPLPHLTPCAAARACGHTRRLFACAWPPFPPSCSCWTHLHSARRIFIQLDAVGTQQ